MTSRSNNAPLPSIAHSLTWPPPARNGARHFTNLSPLPANGPGQTVNGWTSVPEGLVDMLEDFDNAFIASAAAAVDPRERRFWHERMEQLQALRQRLDAANPARSVPLVPR